jgi:hypothetical protein
MAIWVFIVLIVMVKVPIAALMLWMPFRNDSAMSVPAQDADGESGDEDGGGQDPPGGSRPRAPRPRRGPHQELPPPPPPRMRSPGRTVRTRLPARQRVI